MSFLQSYLERDFTDDVSDIAFRLRTRGFPAHDDALDPGDISSVVVLELPNLFGQSEQDRRVARVALQSANDNPAHNGFCLGNLPDISPFS